MQSVFDQRLLGGFIQSAALMAAVVGLLLASEAYSFLPTPLEVFEQAIEVLKDPQSMLGLAVTLYEASVGLALATGIGVFLGMSIGSSAAATAFANPVILALYSVPKIVFLPILMLIFGVGTEPKIASATMHAVFPILLNSLVAAREIDATHLKLARSLSASRVQTIFKIMLPGMILPVFAGLRLGVGLSFMGALLAELFQSTDGVGYAIQEFYNRGNIAGMVALVVFVFITILVLNAVMKTVENKLSRWRRL